ncbi:MAG: hypothetical protein O3A00_02375 [Planctomycetota bacterium]|nr:hypothetical protein [Planctomycetota bacterium]
MRNRQNKMLSVIVVQALTVVAFGAAYAMLGGNDSSRFRDVVVGTKSYPRAEIPRDQPWQVTPLYDDATVVSDDDLAAVLHKIRPRFNDKNIRPNLVEHALRAWGIHAKFDDPGVMSGEDLKNFLVDHGRFLRVFKDVPPLLQQQPEGVAIRWGRQVGGSVHHDHWLACLTEAGIDRHHRVTTQTRMDMTIDDVIQEALRDFKLDEREVEWSVMAFGFWLVSDEDGKTVRTWKTNTGRELSFDLLAKRLIRGHKQYGVCTGTHRVYSAMVLIRLDDTYKILSESVRAELWQYLEKTRDLIEVCQFADGHWPYNWWDGKESLDSPLPPVNSQVVIATGHHLEWLSIAPLELHPFQGSEQGREMIRKAAKWLIANVKSQSDADMLRQYTFYSHVGNALALWRKTRPEKFWREHGQAKYPYVADHTRKQASAKTDAKVEPTEQDANPKVTD